MQDWIGDDSNHPPPGTSIETPVRVQLADGSIREGLGEDFDWRKANGQPWNVVKWEQK